MVPWRFSFRTGIAISPQEEEGSLLISKNYRHHIARNITTMLIMEKHPCSQQESKTSQWKKICNEVPTPNLFNRSSQRDMAFPPLQKDFRGTHILLITTGLRTVREAAATTTTIPPSLINGKKEALVRIGISTATTTNSSSSNNNNNRIRE